MGCGRVRRTVAEKRRIVELTLEPGASVARIAQTEGVNANQVFQWRRAYRSGGLNGGERPRALLPVVVPDQEESAITADERAEAASSQEPPASGGLVHIEFPGRALISIESGASPAVVRAIIESLRR